MDSSRPFLESVNNAIRSVINFPRAISRDVLMLSEPCKAVKPSEHLIFIPAI